MICITGPGGTVGSELVRQLAAAKTPFRAAHHSEAKADAARADGVEVALIEYAQPDTLRAAFRGCDRLFLLGPGAPHQTQLELNAVAAAKDARVRHIVKLSVLGADEGAFAIAKIHRPVERAIEASGLAWTFLRPNSYMQNVVTYMSDTIRSESAIYSAAGDGRIAHVDVRDIAAVAVRALTAIGHEHKAYSLTGPEALSYDDVARELSNALGRTIRHVRLSPLELKQGMLADGVPEEIADALVDLDRFYRENGASRVTGDVRHVTGRAPRRFADYAREHVPLLAAK